MIVNGNKCYFKNSYVVKGRSYINITISHYAIEGNNTSSLAYTI